MEHYDVDGWVIADTARRRDDRGVERIRAMLIPRTIRAVLKAITAVVRFVYRWTVVPTLSLIAKVVVFVLGFWMLTLGFTWETVKGTARKLGMQSIISLLASVGVGSVLANGVWV